MDNHKRCGFLVGRAAALIAAVCMTLLSVVEGLAEEPALTPHEKYITQYRRLSTLGKSEEREQLRQSFLAEAQAYITEHPEGPQIVQAKLNKALVIGLYGERREAEADKLLKEITSDYPDSPVLPEAMYWHAWLLDFAFGGERHEEKRAIALELLERFPESVKAPFALSLAAHSYLVDAGDAEAATALLRRVVKEYPGTGAELNSRRDLIRIAAEAGDVASVRRQVDAFLERFHEAPEIVPPDSWAWLLTADAAETCMRIGDWDRAENLIRTVAEEYKGTAAGLKAEARLIRVTTAKGDEAAALEQVDAFLERYKTVPEGIPAAEWARVISGTLADACSRLEAWDRLEKCHNTVLNVVPEGDLATEALFGLARAYGAGFDGERVDERASTLLDITTQYPGSVHARRALLDAAACYEWRILDKAKANELYERVIANYPGTREELDARVHLISMALYGSQDEIAAQRLGAYDGLLAAENNEARVRTGKLLLARACNSFYGNNPSRAKFGEQARSRYIDIANSHPGSEEAAEALLELCLCYARPKNRDTDKARHYALLLLRDNPARNRARYARAVADIMQNRALLLTPIEDEIPHRAQDLADRHRAFTCHERHSFLMKADSLHAAARLEALVRTIIADAREQNDTSLVKDALLFLSEAYLRKQLPDKALRRLAELDETGIALTPDDERRVLEVRAFAHLLRQNSTGALIDIEELVHRSTTSVGIDRDGLRASACYEYWQAVARFVRGNYAASASLFAGLMQRHPDTPWAHRAALYLELLLPLVEGQ